jgi:integrase/recombinase XerD
LTSGINCSSRGGWCHCARRGQLDPLTAVQVQVNMWVRAHTDTGARPSTILRRVLAALSSWYRYLAAHDVIKHHPVSVVVRHWVDPDHSETIGVGPRPGPCPAGGG